MGKPTIWYEANLAIVRRYWGKEPIERIHERVVQQLEKDARAEGRPVRQTPLESAIIYAAHKAGVITEEEAEQAYKARRLKMAREHKRAYRARNSPGHFTAEHRVHVTERDAGRCQYCGEPGEHVDHLQPVTRGGTGDTWNLTLACQSCNSSKGNKDLGPSLIGAMQRLLQGGWRHRGDLLLDHALKQIEKRALEKTKGLPAPKALLAPLTRPHLYCPRCRRISDSSTAQLVRLRDGRVSLACGLCKKPAALEATVGFYEMGQKVDRLDPWTWRPLRVLRSSSST